MRCLRPSRPNFTVSLDVQDTATGSSPPEHCVCASQLIDFHGRPVTATAEPRRSDPKCDTHSERASLRGKLLQTVAANVIGVPLEHCREKNERGETIPRREACRVTIGRGVLSTSTSPAVFLSFSLLRTGGPKQIAICLRRRLLREGQSQCRDAFPSMCCAIRETATFSKIQPFFVAYGLDLRGRHRPP